MNSGYVYVEQEGSGVSLILKQFRVGRKRILFALVGVQISKEWEEYISIWLQKRIRGMRKASELLKILVKDLYNRVPIPEGDFFGMCLCGEEYVAFGKGEVCGMWLYRRFMGYKLKSFRNGSLEWKVWEGCLEKGGGILICTKEYLGQVDVSVLGNLMLEQRGVRNKGISDKQISKRLKENYKEGVGAIFLRP